MRLLLWEPWNFKYGNVYINGDVFVCCGAEERVRAISQSIELVPKGVFDATWSRSYAVNSACGD